MGKETPLIGEMSEGQRGLLPPLRRAVADTSVMATEELYELIELTWRQRDTIS